MRLRHVLTVVLSLAIYAGPSLAAAPPDTAEAADTFVDKLGATPVTLPIPPGFGAPSATPKVVSDLIVRSVPVAYRYVGMLMAQGDLDEVAAGGMHGRMKRYVVLLTYRDYEDKGMPAPLFDQVKVAIHQQGAQLMKAAEAMASPVIDHMSQDVAKLTGDAKTSMKMGGASMLGVFDEHPNSIALASASPMTMTDRKGTETFNQVMAMAVVLLHGKPIGFHVYADHDSPADIDWAEAQVRDWVKRVNELNP